MILVQVLLPRISREGASLDPQFAQTRAELVEKFKGLTAYLRAPAQGAWMNPEGRVERDDMVMVEVVADVFDRAWWRGYQNRLTVRFDQRELHIRALPMETP